MIDARTLARLAAVQAIYEQEHSHDDIVDIAERIERVKKTSEIKRLNKKLCEGILTVSRETSIINSIKENLAEGWTVERIGGVLRAILVAAIAEKQAFPETPKNIIVSEYVAISGEFYGYKEVKFVNAILDKVLT